VSHSSSQVASYLGGLAVFLRNRGGALPEPTLDRYEAGEIGFEVDAEMSATGEEKPATIKAIEIWKPVGEDRYERAEYAYDLIDYPLDRRRAFHLHDASIYLARLGVTAHEHCEEVLGHPTCDHYLGLPQHSGYEALNALLACWSDPGPLGCAGLECVR
jgi:hypothetical protein